MKLIFRGFLPLRNFRFTVDELHVRKHSRSDIPMSYINARAFADVS